MSGLYSDKFYNCSGTFWGPDLDFASPLYPEPIKEVCAFCDSVVVVTQSVNKCPNCGASIYRKKKD